MATSTRREYGVVLGPATLAVDAEATAALRLEQRRAAETGQNGDH